jgi:hypothetical protein
MTSPNISATELNIGTIKTGQDKNKWIILPVGKSQKWIKLIGQPKKYETEFNGGNPYRIIIAKNMIIIMKISNYNEKNKKFDYELYNIIKKYKNIYIGKSSSKYSNYKQSFIGNSILIEKSKNKYIFIGGTIFEFSLSEQIDKFYSPMGNNGVPYPFIITQNYTYLLLERIYISNDVCPKNTDPYDFYYKNIKNIKINKF